MTYPLYRQDFETGGPPWTLAAVCPELQDQDSAYGIDTTPANALTGNNSLKLVTTAGSHSISSNLADTLGGDVTFSAYIKTLGLTSVWNIYAQLVPVGYPANVATSYIKASLAVTTGLGLVQSVNGTPTTLNAGITGGAIPLNVGYICFELRCHGTTVSCRAIRQDNGQFYNNVGSGGWSGSVVPATTGTTTLAPAAGGWGIRGTDGAGCYLDDLVIGPGAPSIDLPTVALNALGATQQLTAGGFTDPLFGVAWASSAPSVATVGSTTGLVTAVTAGTATITATGKRDGGQTATSAVTVTTGAVTAITATPPSPASGYAHNASAAITFALGNGTQASPVIATPTDGGAGGTFTPATLTLSSGTRSGTCTYTPGSFGTDSISCTNNGALSNPTPFTYTANPQTLAVTPNAFQFGTPVTATFTGGGSLWQTGGPPTLTVSGVSCTAGAPTVTSNTSCTALVTPGGAQGSVTFTDSTTAATTNATVGPVVQTTTFLSGVTGFATGLVGTAGYLVMADTGATFAARTTAGVFAVGTNGYAVKATVPGSGQAIVLWDDGSGRQAFEVTPALASALSLLTTQMTESYAADGTAPTLAQCLFAIQQRLTEFGIVGPALTVRKLDGATAAYQLTLNSPTAPTDSTRTS